MKTRHLLIALTISTFTIASIPQYAILAQPNQPEEPEALTTTTAQQVAAKVTVRIQVGQSGGSGVIIGKKANTYLVLTNAHVVREPSGIKIKTPDGQTHTAQKVKNTQVGNFDIALLEFSSPRSYQQAGFNNFGNRDAALSETREIFAAGFPYDSNALRVVEGEVTQLPQEAFVNGTQIGYTTKGDIKQGMSGGPIFDSFGSLVGINSTLARPVIDSYTYADGTKAPLDKIAEYRQANWSVPIYNLLTRLNPDILYGYKNLPKLHRMTTPTGYMAQLDRQARLVTVRIENSGGNGSGVIVARDGNSYYVLTAEHVVTNKDSKQLYSTGKITTQDQRAYKISPSDIKRSPGTDLAIVKFTSTQSYAVATLGNYLISDYSLVFSGGWPAPRLINSQQWQWQLNPGEIRDKQAGDFMTQDKTSFSETYDLLHNSITYRGMSGGPIFDSLGQVIGIHGKGEGHKGNETSSDTVLGNSVGISTQTFLSFAQKLGVNQRSLKVGTTIPVALDSEKLTSVNRVRRNIPIPNNASNAQQWIEYGNQLYRLGEYPQAVTAFNRAITLQANSLDAYYGKGLALAENNNDAAALSAFDKAISLVPPSSQSKFYYLWKNRSFLLRKLGDNKGALAAISEALRLEPEDVILWNDKAHVISRLGDKKGAIAIYDRIIAKGGKDWAYYNRGNLKSELGDKKGAIADYDLAIRINSQSAQSYYKRGIAKDELDDSPQERLRQRKGAIADYEIAAKISSAQNNRFLYSDIMSRMTPDGIVSSGYAKYAVGDTKGAISHYDLAIRINPQLAEAYYVRGIAKSDLGDKKGGISDYDIAIRINPQYYRAYIDRGSTKSELDDKKGAIADYDIAIRINPQSAKAYYNRGIAKYNSGDKKGGISDYDMAIRMHNPQLAEAYSSQGLTKLLFGDKEGATADYDIANGMNPQDANTYYIRGFFKYELGDKKGAISEYDMAIDNNPKLAEAYSNRGVAKSSLGDSPQERLRQRKGAIVDLNIAAQLFKAQNNMALYDRAMSLIQQISQK